MKLSFDFPMWAGCCLLPFVEFQDSKIQPALDILRTPELFWDAVFGFMSQPAKLTSPVT